MDFGGFYEFSTNSVDFFVVYFSRQTNLIFFKNSWRAEFIKWSGFKMFTQALHNVMFEIGMLLAVVGKTCAAFPQCNIQDMGFQ